jgi:NAD+ synthase
LREILSKRRAGEAWSSPFRGIDSSVSAALCIKAIGKERVLGLLPPEQDSAAASTSRGDQLAQRHLGIDYEEFNITTLKHRLLRAARSGYPQRFPDQEGWANKIKIQGGLEDVLITSCWSFVLPMARCMARDCH